MMYIILGLLALFLMFDTRTKTDEVANSKHFHLSHGASKDVYIKMVADGLSEQELKRFVSLEDRFLQLEKVSILEGKTYIGQATLLSNMIKDLYPKYNFSYHTIHLKIISEPEKTDQSSVS